MDAEIAALLMGHLSAGYSDLPIAWPNVDFTPPQTAYLHTTHFKAPSSAATLTSHNRLQGIFQISVMMQPNSAIIPGLEEADKITALFKRGTKLHGTSVTVQVVQPPSVGSPINEKARLQIPVSVRWDCWAVTPQ